MGIPAAVIAFVTTNIDDLFMLMLLFSQAITVGQRRAVWLGQFISIGALTGVSVLIALGLGHLPGDYLRLLGVVPIVLGVRLLLRKEWNEDTQVSVIKPLSVAALVISGGGDNLGVYIPLFSGRSPFQLGVVFLLFLLLTGVWCFLGGRMARVPPVQETLRRCSRWLVPAVFLLLGGTILLGIK